MSKFKNIDSKMSIQTVEQKQLHKEIIEAIEGREAFKHLDNDLNERLFEGSVFETIFCEQTELEDIPTITRLSKEALSELNELSKLIDADYILVTNYGF